MADKMAPTKMKMEAMMIKMTLQLAETKTPAIVMPTPLPSSLDSIRSFSITDSGRLEVEGRSDVGVMYSDADGGGGSENAGLKALLPRL